MTTKDLMANPYVGPRTFSEAQRTLFFGREREARDLLARVLSERLILFYAQSGAGKSSLLNTRLIPQLRDEKDFAVLPVGRVGGALPPGDAPVDNVFVFSLLASIDQGDDSARLAKVTLLDFLARLSYHDRAWIYDAAATPVQPGAGQAGRRYTLLVDQFEEIFTAHPGRWAERMAFFQQLDQAMRADPNLWVVLTLREDYVAALDPYAPLLADRLRARFYMERMGIDAALEAIRRPAVAGGMPFAAGVAEKLADDLRQVRIPGQDVTVAGQYVEPVQLQVVCFELWQNLQAKTPTTTGRQISLEDLTEAGDVDRALVAFYEGTLTAVLNEPLAGAVNERKLRTWFEEALITKAGARGLVHQGEQETGGLPNALVRKLQERFLVRSENRSGDTWIELVHDRLVEPVQESNARWRSSYHNPLTAATSLWVESGRSSEHLLADAQLSEAQAFAQHHAGELTADEQALLQESTRQAHKAARLRRRIMVAAAVVFVALTLLSIWAIFNTFRAQEQARIADSRALAAEAVAELTTDPEKSILLALAALEQEQTAEAEYALRQAMVASRITKRIIDAGNRIWDVAVLPGEEVKLVAGGSDHTVKIWATTSPTSTTPVVSLEVHEDEVLDVAVDALGQRIASASSDGTVKIWDVATGAVLESLDHQGEAVTAAVFSPDGDMLATASLAGWLRLWDIAAGRQITKIQPGAPGQAVLALAFSPDGRRLAVGGDAGHLTLWRVQKDALQLQSTLVGHANDVSAVAFAPDGQRLASAGRDETARLWDLVDSGREIRPGLVFPAHTDTVFDVSFSQDGLCIATASLDRTVKLWDAETGQLLQTLAGHDDDVYSVAFLPAAADAADVPTQQCGTTLVTTSKDGTIRIWNIGASGETPPWIGHTDAVEAVQYSPDKMLLATAGSDGVARLWDAATGALVFALRGHSARINRAAFSPDGALLATASNDGTARLWSTATGAEIWTLQEHVGTVQGVDFSPDGRTVATAGADGRVIFWDVASGEVTGAQIIYVDEPRGLFDVAYSPDAALLVVAGERKEAIVLGLQPAQLLAFLPHDAAVYDVAFSPDGTRFATASWDETARIWSAAAPWDLQHILEGHNGRVFGVAFSRDGQQLATASADQTAAIWDVETGRRLQLLLGAGEELNSPAFSADAATLAVGSDDGTVRFYLLEIEDLVRAARERLTRQLTAQECANYPQLQDCGEEVKE